MVHGGDVWQGGGPGTWLDFSANLRPEGMPEWVREALCGAMENARYYPEPGMGAARAALGAVLGVPQDCVLPTAGGIAAIDLAASLPGGRAVCFAPCFGEYAARSAVQGKAVVHVPLIGPGRAMRDPAEAVKDVLRTGDIAFLCSPLNPVGTAFSRAQIERLLGIAQARLAWLVVDEAFIAYCPEHSVADWAAARERLIVVGSMTKALGIPGVRLGYVCAGPEIVREMERRQTPWALGCFAQAVLRALPDHMEEVLADAAKCGPRRAMLRQGLEALGAHVYDSSAPFLLADMGCDAGSIACTLKKNGILVRLCEDFETINDGRHMRLAVKTETENARLLAAMEEAMACAENR